MACSAPVLLPLEEPTAARCTSGWLRSLLVGLDCDDVNFHSPATARDSGKVRKQALQDLGRGIVRISELADAAASRGR